MGLGVLLPAEVPPEEAARTLGALNGVAGAAALATLVGFAEGPTVGRAVAEMVLAARPAGGYPDLSTLWGVVGVNAARFTEIVVALSGAVPPREVPAPVGPAPVAAPAVAGPAIAPGLTLSIEPARRDPWLGQPVPVLARLRDGAGRGVPGVEATFVATWGQLGADGATGSGPSLRLTGAPGGLYAFRLGPPLGAPLAPDAAAALSAALGALPAAALRARGAADQLSAIAAAYRAEAGVALRAAIDRLLALDPAADGHPDAPWPVQPVTLIGFAGAEGAPPTVGLGSLGLRLWLGAFRAALTEAVAGDGRLDGVLGALAALPPETTGGDLARRLLGATRAIAALEPGAAGAVARDGAAQAAIGRFLDRAAPGRSAAVLGDVVRAAGASGAAIKGGGLAVFDAIERVQDVQGSIKGRGGRGTVDAGVVDRLGALEARAVDRAVLERFRGDVLAEAGNAGRAEGRAEGAALATRLAAAETALARKVEAEALDARLSALDPGGARIAAVEGRLGALDAGVAAAGGRIAALDAGLAQLDPRIGALDSRLGQTDARLGALDADLGQTGTRVAALDARMVEERDAVATRIAALDGTLRAVDTRLSEADAGVRGLDGRVASVAERVEGLGSRVAATEDQGTRIAALDTALRGLDARVGGLDTRVIGVDTQIRGLATRVENVDSRIGGLATQVEGVDSRIGGLATRVEGVDGRVGGLATRVDSVDTRVGGIATRVEGVDTQIRGIDFTRLRGPIR